jgi:hypothetical protein
MNKKIFSIFLLFLVTLFVFQYTTELREPWMGKLSASGHQYLTGSTVKFSKNWYYEGPLKLKFSMLENPKSVEFNTLQSRDPYTSYPPGTIIPIYIISEIKGIEPTPQLVMEYNLLNHFLIAFLLSLIVFFTFLQLKLDIICAFIFSTTSIIIELLLPGTLYWHQNVFFSDQAVILPFVSFIFLEIFRSSYLDNKRIIMLITISQAIIMFYGALTDWLFLLVALVVYTKRILDKEIILNNIYKYLKESFKYWIPAILAIFLFITQIFYLGTVKETISKAFGRTDVYSGGYSYTITFLSQLKFYFFHNYGSLITWILFISLIICAIISFFMVLNTSKAKR